MLCALTNPSAAKKTKTKTRIFIFIWVWTFWKKCDFWILCYLITLFYFSVVLTGLYDIFKDDDDDDDNSYSEHWTSHQSSILTWLFQKLSKVASYYTVSINSLSPNSLCTACDALHMIYIYFFKATSLPSTAETTACYVWQGNHVEIRTLQINVTALHVALCGVLKKREAPWKMSLPYNWHAAVWRLMERSQQHAPQHAPTLASEHTTPRSQKYLLLI